MLSSRSTDLFCNILAKQNVGDQIYILKYWEILSFYQLKDKKSSGSVLTSITSFTVTIHVGEAAQFLG